MQSHWGDAMLDDQHIARFTAVVVGAAAALMTSSAIAAADKSDSEGTTPAHSSTGHSLRSKAAAPTADSPGTARKLPLAAPASRLVKQQATAAGVDHPNLLQTALRCLDRTFNNATPTFQTQISTVNLNQHQSSGPITLVGNDSDGDPLVYTIAGARSGTSSAGGMLTIDGDTATYTPPSDWDGTSGFDDAFVVTASDAHGGWHIHGLPGLLHLLTFGLLGSAGDSASATITVRVRQLEPPPVVGPAPDPDPPVADPDQQPPSTAATAAERAFWTTERGVGFSVGSLGALNGQARMEEALQEVSDLGFNMIRTWGTDGYTGRILEAITRLDLPLKVQPGIWITQDAGARDQIDAALAIITPYADKVVGVSLGNEQVVDWNTWSSLTVPELTGLAQYFKGKSTLPVTYNFAGETFLPGASQWGQGLTDLIQELDYVNVHSYGGFFDNRNNPAWTPALQLASVQSFETMLADKFATLGLAAKPLILGETGWQSAGYNPAVTNAANQQQYYELVSRYVYGPDARFDGMYYFNFTDESWKGGDDGWGLFKEGSSNSIGSSKFAIVSVPEVLAGVSNPLPNEPDPTSPDPPTAAAGSFPVSFVNNTGGAFGADEIFVTIFGQTTPGHWAWVDATGTTHQLDHTAANADGHLVQGGTNYADMSFTLADAADLRVPPRLEGARIYLSLGKPLYIGISPDDSGWAGPDPNNPTDPNFDTVYDWYEMTYEYGRIPFGGNTTQVDLFGIPFTFTLTQTSPGFSGTRGITLSRDEVFRRFEETMPAAFQALIVKDDDGNPLRMLAPRSNQPGELATWFDGPVDAFWTKYADQQFVYNGPGFTVTGTVDSGNRFAYTVTSAAGAVASYTMTKPSTADIFRADGPFIGTGLQGAFLAHLNAAFHRGVATSPQNWDTASAYYPVGGRWNNWAQFFHANSIGGYAYGFPYDDVNSQSPVLILNNSQPLSRLQISVGY
jgi:exo-beta-1,3-glucanase (GH17 family)